MSVTCAATRMSRVTRDWRVPLEPRAAKACARPAFHDGKSPKKTALNMAVSTAKPNTRPSIGQVVLSLRLDSPETAGLELRRMPTFVLSLPCA